MTSTAYIALSEWTFYEIEINCLCEFRAARGINRINNSWKLFTEIKNKRQHVILDNADVVVGKARTVLKFSKSYCHALLTQIHFLCDKNHWLDKWYDKKRKSSWNCQRVICSLKPFISHWVYWDKVKSNLRGHCNLFNIFILKSFRY